MEYKGREKGDGEVTKKSATDQTRSTSQYNPSKKGCYRNTMISGKVARRKGNKTRTKHSAKQRQKLAKTRNSRKTPERKKRENANGIPKMATSNVHTSHTQ